MEDFSGCFGDTSLTIGGRDVAAAKKEAVDLLVRVLAKGGLTETIVWGLVGKKCDEPFQV